MPGRNYTFLVMLLCLLALSSGIFYWRGAEARRLEAEIQRLMTERQQLEEHRDSAEAKISSLRRELGDREETLRSLRENIVPVYRLTARTRVLCDRSIGLRNPLNPVLDLENPRVGTIIRLTSASGETLTLTNPQLAVAVEDLGQRKVAFEFVYVLVDEDAVFGRGIGYLESFNTLWVRYLPLLSSLGYCSDEARLDFFTLAVNDVEVVRAGGLGALAGDSSRFSIAGAMRGLNAKYFENLSRAPRAAR